METPVCYFCYIDKGGKPFLQRALRLRWCQTCNMERHHIGTTINHNPTPTLCPGCHLMSNHNPTLDFELAYCPWCKLNIITDQ